MTDRIDHAAEARAALKGAQMNPADADVITDPWLLAAQVHATLALVEQQRLANLITLAQFSFDGWEPNAAQRELFGPQIGTEASDLTDDARRVLGLTVESR